MRTVLIMIVLLAIGAAVYQALVLQAAVRAGQCNWRVLFDPRPVAPRHLRYLAGGFWLVIVLGLAALLGLRAQS